MTITFKLFAMLAKYLPRDAVGHAVEIDVPDGASPHAVLALFGVPRTACQLLLVNGHFVVPSERDSYRLKENDALAAWPPIAGG